MFGPLLFRLMTGHLPLTEQGAEAIATAALHGLLRAERDDTHRLKRRTTCATRSWAAPGSRCPALTLGCMSWGDPARGGHPWVARRGRGPAASSRTRSRPGITFFDTANVYSAGSSEEITGRALARLRATARRS